jgi:tRNA A-37 threonylcarbamoyl transferase component Bud32
MSKLDMKTKLLELQKIAKKLKIKNYEEYLKRDLLKKILMENERLEKSKKKSEKKYIIKEQLGNKGKEGKTFLVIDNKFNTEYAMKKFRSNKSSEKIMLEVNLQRKVSELGLSPKIVDFDIDNKFIVMEKMDWHLTEEITFNNGLIPENRQKEIINIFQKLDKLKIFHGDANLLNYMVKDDKLYIIDFGMGQEIDIKLKEKIKAKSLNCNLEFMLLGFILKLKESNCPKESYTILKHYLDKENLKKFEI